MKRSLVLVLVFCLLLAIVPAASAAGAPKIKKQPTDQTTSKKGSISFSISATNFTNISWHFVNPATGDDYTGKELRDNVLKDVKGFKISVTNKRQKVTLEKVPDSMHGWEVYAVLTNNAGYSINTDRVRLWIYGLAQTDSTPVPAQLATPSDTATGEQSSVPSDSGPKTVTVSAENLTLIPLDARGNLLEDQAASVLTFDSTGSVAVRAESPVQYWLINGIRIETTESITGFILKNITADLAVSAKFEKTGEAVKEADPSRPCQITCTGCVFTYHSGGLRSVSSGSVPYGATIIVIAASGADVSQGYTVNGGKSEHAGSTSFRLQVEGDTVISLP